MEKEQGSLLQVFARGRDGKQRGKWLQPPQKAAPAASAGLNGGFEGQEPEREPGPWHGFDPTAAREEESSKNVLGQSMFSEVSEALWRALSK